MRTYIALAVTIVWATAYLFSLAQRDYTGFEIATPVMLIAATYLLSSDIHRNGRNDHRHDDEP